MYKLLRRISSSFFPRPDRPWEDDGEHALTLISSRVQILKRHVEPATSNAPQIGKKRRMSDEDEDMPPSGSIKKSRTGLLPVDGDAVEEGASSQETDATTEDVKEVTKGVRDVELEEGKKTSHDDEPAPAEEAAAVPLPESPVLAAQPSETTEASAEPSLEGTDALKEKSEEGRAAKFEPVAEAQIPTVEDSAEVKDASSKDNEFSADAPSTSVAVPEDVIPAVSKEEEVPEHQAEEEGHGDAADAA